MPVVTPDDVEHPGAGVDQLVAMTIAAHLTASMFERYRIVAEGDLRAALERTEAAREAAPARNVVPLRPAEG